MQTNQSNFPLASRLGDDQIFLQEAPAYWIPRYPGEGGVLRYAPFLFWLTAVLKPKRIAVLGIGDGAACFAICQTIERLHLDCRCAGVELSAAVPSEIADGIKKHASHFYEGILSLHRVQPSIDATWPDLDNQDLVLLDLQEPNNWPAELLDNLPSRLSPNGCLVVHSLTEAQPNTDSHLAHLLSQSSGHAIDIGKGLLVFSRNSDVSAALINHANGRIRHEARTMFSRLGNSLTAMFEHDALMSQVAEQQTALTEAQFRIDELEAEVAALTTALDLRGRKANQFQVRYFESERKLSKLRWIQSDAISAEAERQEKRLALAERDSLNEKLRQSRETHYNETAALTVLLEAQRASATNEAAALRRKLETQCVQSAQEAKVLRQKLDTERSKVNSLELDNDALLSSSSWKITSPFRRIASMLRRQPYHR